jgi:hypothetical protein
MATYAELDQESRDGTLFTKIKVACFIAANTIAAEAGATTNHANRLLWAKQVYQDPEREAQAVCCGPSWPRIRRQLLPRSKAATDAQVQTAVNGAVDVFANGTA